jgi:hypothetical protein
VSFIPDLHVGSVPATPSASATAIISFGDVGRGHAAIALALSAITRIVTPATESSITRGAPVKAGARVAITISTCIEHDDTAAASRSDDVDPGALHGAPTAAAAAAAAASERATAGRANNQLKLLTGGDCERPRDERAVRVRAGLDTLSFPAAPPHV